MLLALTLGALHPASGSPQTLPGPAYHELMSGGHEVLARDLARRLDLRSDPSPRDVERLLDRWDEEAGGPSSGYDWLAVARLWLRAGDADRAESALERAEGRIPEALWRIDRARIAFLRGEVEGASDYWAACAVADETAATELWLDVEVLATPDELEAWNRFRTLPAGDRDDCAFLRRLWNRRAAASAMDVDARILEHYSRSRFALDHYRRRGRVKPRFSVRLGRPPNAVYDDRGLLYVRMGEPDEVAVHLGGECIEPNVSWGYDRPGGYRVYHLSPLAATDDWYLLENLAIVYRCGSWDRNPMVAISPLLLDVPGAPFHDLYLSRMGLDPRYARIADQAMRGIGDPFGASALAELLADEREWTWEDGEYAIASVPGRPDVDLELEFGLEWLQFRASRPGLTRVWLNGVARATDLEGLEGDGVLEGVLDVRWTLLDASDLVFRYAPASFEVSVAEPVEDETGVSFRVPLDVPPGTYRWTVAVENPPGGNGDGDRSRTHGGYARGEVVVRDLTTDLPVLSDVAVSPDSLGTWSPVEGVRLNPTPAHITGEDAIAFIYYEAYNLTRGGRYETRVILSPDGEGRTFDVTYPATVPAGASVVTPGYLRVDLSDSDPGDYTMTVTVRDLTSGHVTLPVNTEIRIGPD